MNIISQIYCDLLNIYGPRGWWPILGHSKTSSSKAGRVIGYHPLDYTVPKNINQQYEICVGAILTQNTAWLNVEKALLNLKKAGLLSAEGLLRADIETIKDAIRPAGYFNQKTKKLIIFSEFFASLKNRTPSREELLNLWGVGRETADSMLLYAFNTPTFVVDVYTKRIFSNIGLLSQDQNYDSIKQFFEENLEKNPKVYQEFHALIVEHAKQYYTKKQDYKNCPLYKRYGNKF